MGCGCSTAAEVEPTPAPATGGSAGALKSGSRAAFVTPPPGSSAPAAASSGQTVATAASVAAGNGAVAAPKPSLSDSSLDGNRKPPAVAATGDPAIVQARAVSVSSSFGVPPLSLPPQSMCLVCGVDCLSPISTDVLIDLCVGGVVWCGVVWCGVVWCGVV